MWMAKGVEGVDPEVARVAGQGHTGHHRPTDPTDPPATGVVFHGKQLLLLAPSMAIQGTQHGGGTTRTLIEVSDQTAIEVPSDKTTN